MGYGPSTMDRTITVGGTSCPMFVLGGGGGGGGGSERGPKANEPCRTKQLILIHCQSFLGAQGICGGGSIFQWCDGTFPVVARHERPRHQSQNQRCQVVSRSSERKTCPSKKKTNKKKEKKKKTRMETSSGNDHILLIEATMRGCVGRVRGDPGYGAANRVVPPIGRKTTCYSMKLGYIMSLNIKTQERCRKGGE